MRTKRTRALMIQTPLTSTPRTLSGRKPTCIPARLSGPPSSSPSSRKRNGSRSGPGN